MLTTMDKKPEWSFYTAWILLTSLCVPIAFFLDLLVLRLIIRFVGDYIYVNGVQRITEDFLGIYVFVPIVGLLTGMLQDGLLRRYLPRMSGWVLATTGGWLLGTLLAVVADRFSRVSPPFNVDLVFIVMGFSIGIAQWLLLRGRLPRAGWWIAANVAGWGLLALLTPGESIGQFGLLAVGFVPACVTGALLALLMNPGRLAESQSI